MRAAGADHGIENRRSMCGLIWLPSPRWKRPADRRLQVPGLGGDRHRAAGERDGDGGGQLEPLGGVGGQHEREERVVRTLEGEGAVVARRLHGAGGRRDLGEGGRDEGSVHAHRATVPVPMGTRRTVVDERAVVVARRAAEQAGAAGSPCPTTSRSGPWPAGDRMSRRWRACRRSWAALLEGSFDPVERRRRGAHFTPTAAGPAARRPGHRRPRATVGRRPGLRRRRPACSPRPVTSPTPARTRPDPRSALGRRHRPRRRRHDRGRAGALVGVAASDRADSCVADALVDDSLWPPLDVVVGNPPFLTPLGAHAARGVSASERLRERFGGAVRAYTDVASLFLLRGCQLARSGGTVAMVQPQSVLAARDAAGVREAVNQMGCLAEVVVPLDRGVRRRSRRVHPDRRGGRARRLEIGGARASASANGVPAVDLGEARRLGDEATTTAAFRSEYYGMVDHVREDGDLPTGRRLVTTGLVDLGRCHWGERRRAHRRPHLEPTRPRRPRPGRSGGPVGHSHWRAKADRRQPDAGGRGRRRRGGGVGGRRSPGRRAGAGRAAVAAGGRSRRAGRRARGCWLAPQGQPGPRGRSR